MDFLTVYVQTIDQKIYACTWISRLENDCWKEIENIPQISNGKEIDGPSYPGEVIDSLAMDYSTRISMSAKYVLLKDGTIMQWTHDPNPFRDRTFTTILCSGIIIGLFAGGVISYKIVKRL